ncbi:Outer membrane porin F precursor [compost metagenome]
MDSIALLFDYNRSAILNVHNLEIALQNIKEPISKLVLIGYTDSLGKTADNRVLASKRIDAVSEFLQKTPWNKVSTEVSNVNETGGYPQADLASNRRVDVLIYTLREEKPAVVVLNTPVNLNITFENASAVIRRESYPNLEKLRDMLLSDSTLNVKLWGHVCCMSAHELSLQRAEAVQNYLLKNGIARSRMYAEGFSNTKPLGPDITEENRILNRRVEAIFHRKTE